MAITCARWNEIPSSSQMGLTQNPSGVKNAGPYEVGDGVVIFFMSISFGADAYDPTNHLTTMPFSGAAGANPRDLFGVQSIQQMEFNGGESSDASLATGGVKASWVENGQYVKLTAVGTTGNDASTAVDESEAPNTAGGLSGMVFNVVCYART